jgi:hypothetical protein
MARARPITLSEFCWRGFNVVLLGVGTTRPNVAAVCRVTGHRFNVSGQASVDRLLIELVQLIEGTAPALWRRSTIDHGWYAVASDHAGRHWQVRPPTMPQGVQPALVA